MKSSSVLIAAAGLLAMHCPAHAAEDQQLWLGLSTSVDLGGGFKFTQESTARISDAQKGLYEVENNFLIGYKLGKIVGIWAGYTHDPLYARGHFMRMERRARQQVTFDNVAKVGGGQISLRVRTEQRWRDGLDGTGWRVRPYVRYTLPIAGKGRTTLNIGHESFINLNSNQAQTVSGYDRMRNNATVKFPISKVVSIEAGYMNQYQLVRAAPNKMDHIAQASLGFSF